MEPLRSTRFDFKVFFLLDWLSTKAREPGLMRNQQLMMVLCVSQRYQCELNATDSAEILTRLADYTFNAVNFYIASTYFAVKK